jgi:hypothetical protein
MYLLKYNEQGIVDIIVPDPEMGLEGIYIKGSLPISIDEMIEQALVEKITDENNKIYYKIKGD